MLPRDCGCSIAETSNSSSLIWPGSLPSPNNRFFGHRVQEFRNTGKRQLPGDAWIRGVGQVEHVQRIDLSKGDGICTITHETHTEQPLVGLPEFLGARIVGQGRHHLQREFAGLRAQHEQPVVLAVRQNR